MKVTHMKIQEKTHPRYGHVTRTTVSAMVDGARIQGHGIDLFAAIAHVRTQVGDQMTGAIAKALCDGRVRAE